MSKEKYFLTHLNDEIQVSMFINKVVLECSHACLFYALSVAASELQQQGPVVAKQTVQPSKWGSRFSE